MRHLFHLTIILILALLSQAVDAQNKEGNQNKDNFFIGIGGTAGITSFNFSGINKKFQRFGLPQLNTGKHLLLIPSIYFGPVSTRVPLSSNISYGSSWQRENKEGYSIKLANDLWEANLFYTIWKGRRSIVCPGLGFGQVNYNIHIHDESSTTSSFDQALNDFRGARHLVSKNNSYLNISVNYRWSVIAGDFIGARIGYRLGLNKQHWKLGNKDVLTGAPSSSARGFYVGINLIVYQ